jgi:hypothetical protein
MYFSIEDHGYSCMFRDGYSLVFQTHNAWVVWTIWFEYTGKPQETEIICDHRMDSQPEADDWTNCAVCGKPTGKTYLGIFQPPICFDCADNRKFRPEDGGWKPSADEWTA